MSYINMKYAQNALLSPLLFPNPAGDNCGMGVIEKVPRLWGERGYANLFLFSNSFF